MISRRARFLLGGLAAVVCVILATLVGVELRTPLQVREIGGAFAMTDTTGHAVTEKTLLGKPTAIAFGFTFCPEVCPTTLSMLAAAMKRMGPDADQLNVVFVTIDPARDTPEQMKLYLSSFDPRIRGFTGTDAQTAAMAKAYGIFYQRVPIQSGSYGEYTMNHTAGVFLFDANGHLVGEIPYDQDQDTAVAKLTTLVQPNACMAGGPPRVDLWSGKSLGDICRSS